MAPFIFITFLYEWDKYLLSIHKLKMRIFGGDKWIDLTLEYVPPPKISREEAKKRYKFWMRAAMTQAIVAELFLPFLAILKKLGTFWFFCTLSKDIEKRDDFNINLKKVL